MAEFLLAAALLGLVAVYVMPYVAGLLRSFLPASVSQYLPSGGAPQLAVGTLVAAAVWGAVFLGVLILFSKLGIKAHTDALEV